MMRRPFVKALSLSLMLAFAAPAFADAKADIVAAYEALVAKSKFRMVGKTTTGSQTMNTWAEVQWPDRYHMRTDQAEFIVIPGKTWMKQGGQWQELPMDMSAMVKSMSPESLRQAQDNMTNIKSLGDDTIDGKDADVYEYDTAVKVMGIDAKSHVKVWIEDDTNLVLRQETDGEAAGQKSSSVQDYEYDDAIDIKAPQ